MTSTNWTNKQGEQKVLKAKQLFLKLGSDALLVEARDELAEALEKEPPFAEVLYNFNLTSDIVTFKRQDGSEGYMNRIILRKIAIVYGK